MKRLMFLCVLCAIFLTAGAACQGGKDDIASKGGSETGSLQTGAPGSVETQALMPGAGVQGSQPLSHPVPEVEAGGISFEGIEKADGGMTVEELFRGRSELAGTEVSVRGKVVKFTPNIMGKNWIHLQDGTSHEGANDITVTTGALASKGDTVVVRGLVTIDKDFGAGYRYDLIIEDAQVTPE